jgi:hypothetical protein
MVLRVILAIQMAGIKRPKVFQEKLVYPSRLLLIKHFKVNGRFILLSDIRMEYSP